MCMGMMSVANIFLDIDDAACQLIIATCYGILIDLFPPLCSLPNIYGEFFDFLESIAVNATSTTIIVDSPN